MPTDWRTLVIWVIALVVIAIVAVFLFQNIILPLLGKIS